MELATALGLLKYSDTDTRHNAIPKIIFDYSLYFPELEGV